MSDVTSPLGGRSELVVAWVVGQPQQIYPQVAAVIPTWLTEWLIACLRFDFFVVWALVSRCKYIKFNYMFFSIWHAYTCFNIVSRLDTNLYAYLVCQDWTPTPSCTLVYVYRKCIQLRTGIDFHWSVILVDYCFTLSKTWDWLICRGWNVIHIYGTEVRSTSECGSLADSFQWLLTGNLICEDTAVTILMIFFQTWLCFVKLSISFLHSQPVSTCLQSIVGWFYCS